jgi:ribosomal protein S18 acetylase RimI-like enzyme
LKTVEDALAHFGVKGMKWGVRKEEYQNYQNKFHSSSPGAIKTAVRTKSGEKITIEKQKPGPIQLAVAKLTGAKPSESLSAMVIRDDKGKKVGSFQMWREGPSTVRGEWLEIKEGSQGRGYSRAAINGLLRATKKDKKLKEVRLQVPSEAGAAKHIYGSLGFKKDKDLGWTPTYGDLEDWVYKVK